MMQRTMDPKKTFFRWTVRLIGIILFIAILSRLDTGRIWHHLSEAKAGYVLLMAVLVIPMLAVKSWRWRRILRLYDIRISPGLGLKLYAIGMFAGFVTPGQVGDLSKSYFLNRLGFPVGPSLWSVLLDRLFDLLVLILAAFWGIEIYWRFMGGGVLAGLTLLLLALLIPMLFIVKRFRVFLFDRLKPLTGRFLRGGPRDAADDGVTFTPGARDILVIFLMTAAVYALIFFRYYLLALAVGIPLSFLSVTGAMALSSVLALLPVSVANVGTRDALLIYLFSGFGIPAEQTVSFSALVLFSFLLNGIIGLVFWITYRQVR
jgi:uncharacterized membrane protein YbhN (UPF0104 family)